jgi:hypothetical protein
MSLQPLGFNREIENKFDRSIRLEILAMPRIDADVRKYLDGKLQHFQSFVSGGDRLRVG